MHPPLHPHTTAPPWPLRLPTCQRRHCLLRDIVPAALFKRAIDLEAQEECYFHFARYLDQLMQDAMQRQAARGAGTSKPMDRIGGKSRSACLVDEY